MRTPEKRPDICLKSTNLSSSVFHFASFLLAFSVPPLARASQISFFSSVPSNQTFECVSRTLSLSELASGGVVYYCYFCLVAILTVPPKQKIVVTDEWIISKYKSWRKETKCMKIKFKLVHYFCDAVLFSCRHGKMMILEFAPLKPMSLQQTALKTFSRYNEFSARLKSWRGHYPFLPFNHTFFF